MNHWLRNPIASLEVQWAASATRRRLDHSPANMCMIIGLMLSSTSIVVQGPTPSSTLHNMSANLQVAMCGFIVVGLGIKLYGALSHTCFFRPHVPLRLCYQKGYLGAPLAASGMLVYAWYIVDSIEGGWLSALGSVLVGFLGVGVMLQGAVYWLEARRLERVERHMILTAQQTKENRHE